MCVIGYLSKIWQNGPKQDNKVKWSTKEQDTIVIRFAANRESNCSCVSTKMGTSRISFQDGSKGLSLTATPDDAMLATSWRRVEDLLVSQALSPPRHLVVRRDFVVAILTFDMVPANRDGWRDVDLKAKTFLRSIPRRKRADSIFILGMMWRLQWRLSWGSTDTHYYIIIRACWIDIIIGDTWYKEEQRKDQ